MSVLYGLYNIGMHKHYKTNLVKIDLLNTDYK